MIHIWLLRLLCVALAAWFLASRYANASAVRRPWHSARASGIETLCMLLVVVMWLAVVFTWPIA